MKLITMFVIPALLVSASVPAIATPVEVRISAPLGADVYGHVVLRDDDYRRHASTRDYQSREIYIEPLIIYAPMSHQQNWHHWCHEYRACGQSVRFIDVREAYGNDYRQHQSRHRHHRHHHEHHHH